MVRRAAHLKPGALSSPGLLSIGALSRATGIPVQTLRTWERRYDSPRPERKPSGHRLYPASLVERLRKVVQLMSHGHRPGEILALPSPELDSLLSLSGGGGGLEPPAAFAPLSASGTDPAIPEMLEAVATFDRGALIALLGSSWARLGPLPFLQLCAGPLMTEVGSAWRAGKLEIRHEHFATACLAGFLRGVREPFDRQARGPRVIAAMLPGDSHEGGLLMASVALAIRGRRVVYLGADTPIAQIASAASEGEARAVALSISAAVPKRRALDGIRALRGALPRRMPLWVGGAGAPKPLRGAERFETLEALDEHLARQ
jgi:methanogenic corrinoid protein MtbC1